MTDREDVLKVLRLPESEIVVTRKVPMTAQTCDELRAIREKREDDLFHETGGEPHSIPFPTLLAQLVREEFNRI